MSLKFEKRQQIGAKGSMDGIFLGGLAECAGRAEALEFGKILHLVSHACAPQRGRRIEARCAHSARPHILKFLFIAC